MIDSITLEIPEGDYHIINDNWFQKKKTSENKGFVYSKRICLYQEEAKKRNEYFPSIEWETSSWKRLLFRGSLPKIYFGSNFYEHTNPEFDSVVNNIIQCLSFVGVVVEPAAVKRAGVSEVELSKLINLSSTCSVSECLEKMAALNYRKCSTLTKALYTQGEAIKYHNKSSTLTMYDKLDEIKNRDGVITNEDKKILSTRSGEEWLKIELSLQSKQAIKSRLGNYIKSCASVPPKDYEFTDLFNTDLMSYVLNNEIQEIFNERDIKFIDLARMQENKLMDYIYSHYNFQEAGTVFSFVLLIKRYGLKKAKSIMKQRMPNSTLYRYQKKSKAAMSQVPLINSKRVNIIKFVKSELNQFMPNRPTAPQLPTNTI